MHILFVTFHLLTTRSTSYWTFIEIHPMHITSSLKFIYADCRQPTSLLVSVCIQMRKWFISLNSFRSIYLHCVRKPEQNPTMLCIWISHNKNAKKKFKWNEFAFGRASVLRICIYMATVTVRRLYAVAILRKRVKRIPISFQLNAFRLTIRSLNSHR